MLRKSLIGMAVVSIVSTAGVAATEPAATGTVRNQAALAVAGRVTPQMRAVAQQCAAVVGRATRTSCAAGGLSHLAPTGEGVAVAVGATAAVIFGGYEAFRGNNNNNTPTPIPVSS